ncbi:MAG: MotA/TolQ/ExbB proton channel family protein [Oligoflexia bacterium]|nr:MotA/TolQ/ExbB proton channel family protein [Oligoflexia bacterium]
MINSAIEAFHEGGFFMWPILVVSLFGIAISFERFKYIFGAASIKKEDFLNRINQHILQGNLERALAVCSQISSPLTNIVKAGLMAVANKKDADEIQTAMDAVALKEIPRLEKRTGLLAMLSNMATLIGLLGTISGLIGAFGAVANVSPSEKATLLAKAISEAMNCTAFGLLVAIPLLGVYGYLQTKSQEVVDDVHEAAVATLNFIVMNKDKFNR